MSRDLIESVRVLRATLVGLQPEQHSGEECAVLVEELATLEKVCLAARVRAAAHAGVCGAPKERGFADVSDWMARASGSTASSAKAALDTAAALEEHPDVKAALGSGELSLAQARELVRTEAECPGAAADLFEIARQHSLKTLKERARDRRVRAIDPEELHALQHAAMHARWWTNKLGNTVCTVELPPEFGEPCHIIGGGPIPVSLARELGQDAFLKAVLHDGTELHTIAHFGRRYPAVLQTALMLGAPPTFEGRICSEPSCDRRYHLERDHIDPCANGGPTTFQNLASPCWPHHRLKTERDRQAGLLHGKARGPDSPRNRNPASSPPTIHLHLEKSHSVRARTGRSPGQTGPATRRTHAAPDPTAPPARTGPV